jgi:carboxylesterase
VSSVDHGGLGQDPRVREFFFRGGERGCLLLHGFTGTPAEMRPLGKALAAEGYTVSAPLLPGHGTRVEDLARTTWEDWFECTCRAWDQLGECAPVRGVAGLSMGALLAVHLAATRGEEVSAMALLAPALRLARQRAAERVRWLRRLPWLPRRFSVIPKSDGPSSGDCRSTPSYPEIPLRALASMVALQHVVARELGRIRVPVLILEGGLDATLARDSAARVADGMPSARVERRTFPRAGHVLTEGEQAEEVSDAVVEFFRRVLGSGVSRA